MTHTEHTITGPALVENPSLIEGLPASPKEAIAQGLRFYKRKNSCKHGHHPLGYLSSFEKRKDGTNSSSCYQCRTAYSNTPENSRRRDRLAAQREKTKRAKLAQTYVSLCEKVNHIPVTEIENYPELVLQLPTDRLVAVEAGVHYYRSPLGIRVQQDGKTTSLSKASSNKAVEERVLKKHQSYQEELVELQARIEVLREYESLGPAYVCATPEIWDQLPKSAKIAAEVGLRFYHTNPCVHGHVPIRKATTKGSVCLECWRAVKRGQAKRDRQDPLKREKNCEKLRKYREGNLEAARKRELAWRQANPSKVKARKQRYKDSRQQAAPNWLTEHQYAEMDKFYEEARRLTASTSIVHHVDHIVPLNGKTVCGLHVPWNLQVLPAIENIRKSNKH